MIQKLTTHKDKENINMSKTIVKVVKSGNRYNVVDKDGVKYTGQITTGGRKKNLTIKMVYWNRESISPTISIGGAKFLCQSLRHLLKLLPLIYHR